MELSRFGISLSKELLIKFDTFIKERNYTNRSEAIRDLIRQELVKKQWQVGREVAGIITFVYDHHKRELVSKLVAIQHDNYHVIVSTQHVHLDHDHCLEIIVVKGKTKNVESVANRIKATKGVKHTELTMATTGKDIG